MKNFSLKISLKPKNFLYLPHKNILKSLNEIFLKRPAESLKDVLNY